MADRVLVAGFAAATAFCTVSADRLAAQGPASLSAISAARVERVVALSRAQSAAKIKNAAIVPKWISGVDQFWYQRDGDAGKEFALVDAATGARRAAFEPAALANALSRASATTVDPGAIAVTDIALVDGAIAVTTSVVGKLYRCVTAAAVRCSLVPTPMADPQTVPSPNGKLAVFVRRDNLWLRDIATGTERALTTDGTVDNGFGVPSDHLGFAAIPRERAGTSKPIWGVSWSPDSRRIFAPQVDQRHVAPYPYIENVPTDGSFRPKAHTVRLALMGEKAATTRWFVIDTASGECRTVGETGRPPSDAELGLLQTEWSADSRQIFTVSAESDFASEDLVRIDADTGEARLMARNLATPGKPWGFGTGQLMFRLIDRGRTLIWHTVRDGYLHLDLVDVDTGKLRNPITRGKWLVRAILGVDEARRTLYFTASGREAGNPYHRYVYSIGLDGRGLKLLTPDVGDHAVIDPRGSPNFEQALPYEALSPDFRYLVSATSTLSKPAVFSIRRTADASLVADFDRTDASALFAAGYKPPEDFVAKAPDGSDLWGVIYRPTDFDPSAKYAVVDLQYNSPLVAFAPRTFDAAATAFAYYLGSAATAELGFVAISVDARGTPGRSQAFSTPQTGYLGTMGIADHVAFIRQAAAKDPSIDLDRVGIAGSSFGGWTVLRAMLTFPDFYKVGVAGTAPGSFHAMYPADALTFTQGHPRYADGGDRRPTATAIPGNFAEVDNAAQVDRLKGRLLILTGEQDENVLPGSTWQFYNAAINADKQVTLLQFPNNGHAGGVLTRYGVRQAAAFLMANLNGTRLPDGASLPTPVPAPAATPKTPVKKD